MRISKFKEYLMQQGP